ncbi:TetR/AcrR family transcriptional regulator [Roseibium sp.]|uniref:TetR/AcrR family transcriptional regulator n=1 Tax=Roseibium sp. TaxID=1936156 RepID=UPI003A98753A
MPNPPSNPTSSATTPAARPRQRRPQARTLKTREKVLEAARQMAERSGGLEELTAEAIAAEAGVAKGTIFAHFTDMDGLLSYLLLDRLAELIKPEGSEPYAPGSGVHPAPLEGVLGKMEQLIRVITTDQTVLRLFLQNTGYGIGTCAPEFLAVLHRLDGELEAFLRAWQEHSQWRPALRQDLDPAEMTDGLIAFMVHAALKHRSGQTADLSDVLARLKRHTRAYLIVAK